MLRRAARSPTEARPTPTPRPGAAAPAPRAVASRHAGLPDPPRPRRQPVELATVTTRSGRSASGATTQAEELIAPAGRAARHHAGRPPARPALRPDGRAAGRRAGPGGRARQAPGRGVADLSGGARRDARRPAGGHVLCAHGDLIPELMHRLVQRGHAGRGPGRCQKGSVWEIELDGRQAGHRPATTGPPAAPDRARSQPAGGCRSGVRQPRRGGGGELRLEACICA